MKRILCLVLSVMMTVALLACGRRVESAGLKALEASAAETAGATPGQNGAASVRDDAVTPEPSDPLTQTDDQQPAATPAVQDAELDKKLCNTDGISVRAIHLTYDYNNELGITCEIKNESSYQVAISFWVEAVNGWSMWSTSGYYPEFQDAARYLMEIEVESGQTQTATVYIPMVDPAVAMMGITQVNNFSVSTFAYRTDDEEVWTVSNTTFVDVTGEPEAELAYPTGETLFEGDKFLIKYLGYDAERAEAYVYIAYPEGSQFDSIRMYPIVNGFYDSYETVYTSVEFSGQIIATLRLKGSLWRLEASELTSLSIGVGYNHMGRTALFVLELPIPAPSADAPAVARGDVVLEHRDMTVRFDRIADAGSGFDTQVIVLDIENHSAEDTIMVCIKDGEINAGGTKLISYDSLTLLPNGKGKLYIELRTEEFDAAEWTDGDLSFVLEYDVYEPIGNYFGTYSYTNVITLMHP